MTLLMGWAGECQWRDSASAGTRTCDRKWNRDSDDHTQVLTWNCTGNDTGKDIYIYCSIERDFLKKRKESTKVPMRGIRWERIGVEAVHFVFPDGNIPSLSHIVWTVLLVLYYSRTFFRSRRSTRQFFFTILSFFVGKILPSFLTIQFSFVQYIYI